MDRALMDAGAPARDRSVAGAAGSARLRFGSAALDRRGWIRVPIVSMPAAVEN